MFFTFSQPQHVLNLFLISFGDFQPHVLIKKVLIKKSVCFEQRLCGKTIKIIVDSAL